MDWSKFPATLTTTPGRVAPDGTTWCLTCDTTILPRADARLCRDCTTRRSNYRRTRNRQNNRRSAATGPVRDLVSALPRTLLGSFQDRFVDFDNYMSALADEVDTAEEVVEETEDLDEDGPRGIRDVAEGATSFYFDLRNDLIDLLRSCGLDDRLL